MQPTVGRIVHYHPADDEAVIPDGHPGDQPLAAIIAYVWHDQMVNLHVIEPGGTTFAKTSVFMAHPEDPRVPQKPYCEWPSISTGPAPQVMQAVARTPPGIIASTMSWDAKTAPADPVMQTSEINDEKPAPGAVSIAEMMETQEDEDNVKPTVHEVEVKDGLEVSAKE